MSRAATIVDPELSAAALVVPVLVSVSFCHLLNDMVQSMIVAVYPMLKISMGLTFAQLGLVTLTYQLVASMLQPLVGLTTDRRPQPYSLVAGMGCTLMGLLLLSVAPRLTVLVMAAAMVGMGSAVFHPEASRVAQLASGGQRGLAQSVFQVGGNAGAAIGPLLAALVVFPHGQSSIAWFSGATLLAILVMTRVSAWYRAHLQARHRRAAAPVARPDLPRGRIAFSMAVLGALMFSKYFYLASFSNFYTFYLMDKFHVGIRSAQLYLFLYLGAAAAGTLLGGPIGDRIGRKRVIWASILGVLPFSLVLPYASLPWTAALTVMIGLILSSAFSAILVYAQELVPGRVGLIAGLFFGLAFGLGGIGAALLGALADHEGIRYVYHVCSYLPLLGILTALLPERRRSRVVPAN
ncbi:MAG: MFS transporter [Holophaga sp.]|jgi:FSR family fosmidomycin resistance protein-like MFS transporter